MKRRLLLLTALMLLLPQLTDAATLYERMRDETLREMFMDRDLKPSVETLVEQFVTKVVSPKDPKVTADEVGFAIAREFKTFCKNQATGKTMDIGFCMSYADRIRAYATAEQKIRTLGRDLQLIAASYELPIDGYPGRVTTLPSRYKSLVNVWRAGKETSADLGPSFRAQPLPDDKDTKWKDLVKKLDETLGKLSTEERTAAVWRYQHGARFVAEERKEYPLPLKPDQYSLPGTERQYLFKRWNGQNKTENVEKALKDMWEKLKADAKNFQPPLVAGDVIFYPEIKLGDITGWVFLEARAPEKANDPIQISGDAGLQWKNPLEPVLPSLFSDKSTGIAIFGGAYPPELSDGRGLCTFPFAKLGYLCRPIEDAAGTECEANPGEKKAAPGSITLTSCKTGAERTTDSGPNICRDALWQTAPVGPEEEKLAAQCRACTVSLVCKSNCSIMNGGFTSMKNVNGNIEICMGPTPLLPATYILIHEMVHAQQLCGLPPNTPLRPNLASCCRTEGEAHAKSCEAMEKDGIFKGTKITAKDCAEYLTDLNCEVEKYGSCSDRKFSEDFLEDMVNAALKNPAKIAESCSAATNKTKLDPRVQAMMDSLNNVCTPECQTKYANTIGNSMCYIGQCIEQSFEEHRLMPGRTPFSAQDEAFPWDSCAAPDPAFASFMTPPPVTGTSFPSYRPGWIIGKIDTALCQVNGLPPQSAAILCETNALRRLEAPLENSLENSAHLINQILERRHPAEQIRRLTPGFGARIGTTLYVNYLRIAGRSLGEITAIAAELLGNLTDIEFPTELCPREGAGSKALKAHPLCSAIGNPPSTGQ